MFRGSLVRVGHWPAGGVVMEIASAVGTWLIVICGGFLMGTLICALWMFATDFFRKEEWGMGFVCLSALGLIFGLALAGLGKV